MDDIPLWALLAALFTLLLLSAFFSSSETAMMALNRYRLKHLVDSDHRSAKLADALLARPDRLISLILLCNNLVNFMAASIATIVGMRLLGDLGVALSPIILVVVFLIFAEVAPKTYAALHPERIAFPAAYVLRLLQRLLYPFVSSLNWITNGLLKYFGVNTDGSDDTTLNLDELRSVVHEAGSLVPTRHKEMLLSILDLEHITVDDIMIPASEVTGIDIEKGTDEIVDVFMHSQHSRLPLYRGNIDNVIGMLHVKEILPLLKKQEEFNHEQLIEAAREPYFVPEATPLHTQLLNFQRFHRRIGLVVDEYGVIQGLLTLEDILEEIVGDFSTHLPSEDPSIQANTDGSYLIDGAATIRDINRQLQWELPVEGPKTLNGLILEQLEDIPESGTSLKIDNYTLEIVQSADNAVKTAKIRQQSAA